MYRFFISLLSALLAVAGLFGQPKAADHGKWLLPDVPSFDAGVYSTALYNTGTGLDQELVPEDAPDAAVDPHYSYMQLVRNATLTDLLSYCAKLERLGYRQTFCNQIENNAYFGYEKGEKRIYVWRSGSTNEVRVADDCCNTASLDAFGYENDAAGKTQPGVYQFSYPYKDALHPDPEVYAANGMLYAVVLSDRRVIVIDGGHSLQATDRNLAEFWRFLHEATGKKADAKIKIAMWFGTHMHRDHNAFFLRFLRRYHEKVDVERYFFNFQADAVVPSIQAVCRLRRQAATLYPEAKYVKPRPGYRFRLQDAVCEVLYTHEDHVCAADASWRMDNANDASTVLKLTLGGKSFLFLGDAGLIVQETLLRNFTAATLRADALQAAHHLYNNLTALYPVVSPTWVFCPQSGLRARTQPLAAFGTLSALVPEKNLLFADGGLCYGLLPDGAGELTLKEIPVDCDADIPAAA